MTGSD